MSSNVPITPAGITAPTPQNTPLSHGPIALGLSRPTVPAISEDGEEASDEPMDIKTDGALSGLQQHMVGMVQGRLAGLLGKSSGYIENLPVDIKLNVEALKGVQVKYNELQYKYRLECLELERKVCFLSFFLLFFFFFFLQNWLGVVCSIIHSLDLSSMRLKALVAICALSRHRRVHQSSGTSRLISYSSRSLHNLINLPTVPRTSKTTIRASTRHHLRFIYAHPRRNCRRRSSISQR
jgi:hypothetical protein